MNVLKRKITRAWLQAKIVAYLLFRKKTNEEKQLLQYLLFHKISSYPYQGYDENMKRNTKLLVDENKKLPYIFLNGKKLYYPKDMLADFNSNAQIRYLNTLLYAEQDPLSPHCYITDDFNVNKGDVVLDIGGAEGNFALSVVEKAAKIYIFEPEKRWIDALHATFEPWKNKVQIIQKFVGNVIDENTVTIDSLNLPSVNFVKADVEGAELDVLKGARKMLLNANGGVKIAICTYHNHEDADVLKDYLEKLGFKGYFSNSFLICFWDKNLRKPWIRKGVFRAEKN
jgi:hypothetical protein